MTTPSGTAPVYQCRAWVNFNGTGTVAIRASGNVSSITDNGVGDYSINFTTAMPDANYSYTGVVQYANTGAVSGQNIIFGMNDGANLVTTTAVRIRAYVSSANASYDCAIVCAAVFR